MHEVKLPFSSISRFPQAIKISWNYGVHLHCPLKRVGAPWMKESYYHKPKSNYLLNDRWKLYIRFIFYFKSFLLVPNEKKILYSIFDWNNKAIFVDSIVYIMTVIAHDIYTKYTNHMSTLVKGNDLLCDRTFHWSTLMFSCLR